MGIKRFSICLLYITLICVLNITTVTVSYAEEYYDTIQISDDLNLYAPMNYSPQINANGYVTWLGGPGGNNNPDWRIFLYDGNIVKELQLPNITSNNEPKINDNGYVVWRGYDGHDYEIFLYDGSKTVQLTDNSYDDWNPKINNQGHVIWTTMLSITPAIRGLYLYDGSQIIQIPNSSNYPDNPQINNNGYIVWEGYNGTDATTYEIFLYNGSSTIQLTNNMTTDRLPRINEDGHVVWANSDGNIFLYDGNVISQLTTDTSFIAFNPQIAGGYISWLRKESSTSTIFSLFLYDGVNTIQLPYNMYGIAMELYANGHILLDAENIYLFNGSRTVQLTNTTYEEYSPKMNANGSIVWARYNGLGYTKSTIALATPYRADITISDSIDPIDDLTIPFANLAINNSSSETITIKNDGTANLNIGLIAVTNPLSAPFSITADNCSSKVLAPASSCTLTVSFTPTVVGSFFDSFNIPSDDTDEPLMTINLSGAGEALPLFPKSLSTLAWSDVVDRGNLEQARKISMDNAGNIYVFGMNAIRKYSPMGTLIWEKCCVFSNNGVIDKGGNIILFGGTVDYRIDKLDTSGNLLWTRTYNTGSQNDWASGGGVDSSGNIFISGMSQFQISGNIKWGAVTVKYDPNGNLLWKNHYLDTSKRIIHTEGRGITIDTNGNAYVIARYQGDLLTIKYNPSGTIVWKQIYKSGAGYRFPPVITTDIDGNIIIGYDDIELDDTLVVKYNPSGMLLWSKVIVTTDDETPHSVTTDNFNNIYLAGDIYDSIKGTISAFIQKYDPQGNLIFMELYHAAEAGSTALAPIVETYDNVTIIYNVSGTRYFFLDVFVDKNFDVYVGGEYNNNFLLAKFIPSGIPPLPEIAATDSIYPYTDLSVNFGAVAVNTAKYETVTITNYGNDNLILGSIASLNTVSSPFVITADNCSGQFLTSGESCALTIRFNPGAEGTFSGSFDIPSNDADESSLKMSLIGSTPTSTTTTVKGRK